MYYAMGFFQDESGNSKVRALRTKSFKTEKAALNAIERNPGGGYIKVLGQKRSIKFERG